MAGRGAVAMAAVALAASVLAGCASAESASGSLPPLSPLPRMGTPASDACDLDTIGGVEKLVADQLSAFRARDFAQAFALSSSQFQSISSVGALQALIDDGRHDEVLDSAAHEFTDCRMMHPGVASALVNVTGANGNTVELAYQFVMENGWWTILMSRPMGSHGQPEQPAASVQPA